ncbi:elongation factor P [symbiont of Argiope bruennichi]|uniref:elongation factor P n=1 Tax=symbiont of Argiope bruennichi TaxID=2810479 RepID=UPI003DA58BA2
MISVNDFSPGITFLYKNNIYQVIESSHRSTARGQAHVKAKVRNLKDNTIIHLTFTGKEKVEKAFIEKKKIQFLYNEADLYFFMDLSNYEQFEFNAKNFYQKSIIFLKNGDIIDGLFFEGEVIDLFLPSKFLLKVTDTKDAVRGNTAQNALKDATLENNVTVKVPLFIKNNDVVIISSDTCKYTGRSNEKK